MKKILREIAKVFFQAKLFEVIVTNNLGKLRKIEFIPVLFFTRHPIVGKNYILVRMHVHFLSFSNQKCKLIELDAEWRAYFLFKINTNVMRIHAFIFLRRGLSRTTEKRERRRRNKKQHKYCLKVIIYYRALFGTIQFFRFFYVLFHIP